MPFDLFYLTGIREQVLETDRWGNFILTGFDYGTARGWARLGLLWANDGVSGSCIPICSQALTSSRIQRVENLECRS